MGNEASSLRLQRHLVESSLHFKYLIILIKEYTRGANAPNTYTVELVLCGLNIENAPQLLTQFCCNLEQGILFSSHCACNTSRAVTPSCAR